jgi:hypothetical protein
LIVRHSDPNGQAWSLPHLTIREKTFLFLAADLSAGNLGFPLATHVEMGDALDGCHAVIRTDRSSTKD